MNYMANLFWFYVDKNWTLDSFNATVYKDLKKLESFIISAVQNYNYDGTVMNWDYSWTFPNSLLLTMTIMSTIGYGHISPVTSWGQLFCIIYAIIGCPLLLVFLGNLGNSMAESFTYIYSRCCCRWCRSVRNLSELPPRASKKQRKLLIDDEVGKEEYMPTEHVRYFLFFLDVPITLTLVVLYVYIMLGAVLFSVWENWDLGSSSYFTFVTLSTIGYGDMVPGTALLSNEDPGTAGLKMAVCIAYILLGQCASGWLKAVPSPLLTSPPVPPPVPLDLLLPFCRPPPCSPPPPSLPLLTSPPPPSPLTSSPSSPGMALLSMCLNLMQEQIVEKCRWLAREIGLTGKNTVEEAKGTDKKALDLPAGDKKKPKDSKDVEKAPPKDVEKAPPKDVEKAPPKDVEKAPSMDTLSVPSSAGSRTSLLKSPTHSIPGALEDL
ncbi:TWiK family of potassium channels protein 7 [Penaeus vannamei]|uniref:TWiK family of potassium channels protein 7 n=1 Tax=Penaeus vannamei TaxID=6689 RepID=A0A423SFD5_PENVA|nr:TWiK family of potassium channels protein 7 [Penaeus vannamei]